MLLPQKPLNQLVYMSLCAAHGLLYGVLYAPSQALLYGFNFRSTLAWIAAGLPFDLIHSFGNLCLGMLILPLSEVLRRVTRAAIPQ